MFATDADPDSGFCQDCTTLQKRTIKRCYSCGSPRIIRHNELYRLAIAHIDCDAFYASVEKRDRPELKDRPVIIGGGKRGVVSTACYIARIRGVRSAMPMFKALEACPDAVVIKPDMEKYAKVGRQIRSMMLALTPQVEPISIDEAFLDLSGTQKLHGQPPARVLANLARRIENEIGVTVSVGLSYCKFLAKIASDMRKPRGFSVIGVVEAVDFLKDQPVSLIWGVGKVLTSTLERDGIKTIGQIQQMELPDLMRRYGTMGNRLYHLSRGIDARRVEPSHIAKNISAETTFNSDLSTREQLAPVLRALSEKVSARLKKADTAGRTVVVKLKTADFKTRTRNRQLGAPTRLADRIFEAALPLLEKELDGTRFRLLGVGVHDLGDADKADPPDLIDTRATRRAKAELAMDTLRDRFGRKAVETGYTFGKGSSLEPQQPADRDDDY